MGRRTRPARRPARWPRARRSSTASRWVAPRASTTPGTRRRRRSRDSKAPCTNPSPRGPRRRSTSRLPPRQGSCPRGRASVGGGGQRAVFAYPAELMDAAQPAGAGDLGGEDLPVPTADDAVGTAVRTDDHTPPPDDAPTTAPRWFDPSASTRPTSTEARATWGAPTAPSRLVDPLHATRPTVDYYDPPQQQQTQTQTTTTTRQKHPTGIRRRARPPLRPRERHRMGDGAG